MTTTISPVQAQIEADRMRFYQSLTEAELVKLARKWDEENAPSAFATNHRGKGGRNFALEALRAKAAGKAVAA